MSTAPENLPELEKAFAKDPTSTVYLALANAYLAQLRFMEAMVICKKGLKAHPDSVEGRLLLARIYAEQGKLPKAIDEAKELLQQQPNSGETHLALAQWLDKSGRSDEAIESYKQALLCNRKLVAATEALRSKGVDFDPGPSPEEIAAQRAEEEHQARLRAEAEEAARKEAEERAAALARAAAEEEARLAAEALAQQTAAEEAAAAAAQTNPALSSAYAVAPPLADPYAASPYGYEALAAQQQGRRIGMGYTVGLAAVLLLVVVGFLGYLKISKDKNEKLVAYVAEAQNLAIRDSTKYILRAVKSLEDAYKISDDDVVVVSQLAGLYQMMVVSRGTDEKDILQRAPDLLKRAESMADDEPATSLALILAAFGRGDVDKALDLAKKAREQYGKEAPPFIAVAYGEALTAKGDIKALRELLDELRDSQNPQVLAFLGNTYRRLGETSRARKAYDDALRFEPDHDVARAARALLVLESGDIGQRETALDDVKYLDELGKDNLGLKQRGYKYLARAELARVLDRAADAEKDLAEAKRLLPKDADAALFTAKALAAKDPKGAIAALQEAIQSDPHRLPSYLTLADLAASQKDFATADKALADGAKFFGDHLDIQLAQAKLLAKKDQPDAAIAALKKLSEAKPDSAEVLRDLGTILVAQNQTEPGVEALKKAAEKSKGTSSTVRASVYTQLGRALLKIDDKENALQAFRTALDTAPNHVIAMCYAGSILADQGQKAEAANYLDKCVRLDPTGSQAAAAREKLATLR